MTRNDYCNALVQATLTNRLPAIEDGLFRYLTSDGRRCPVGLLLPDDSPLLQSIRPVSALNPDLLQPYIPKGMSVVALQIIQTLHDENARDADNKLLPTWTEAQKQTFINRILEYFRSNQ